MIFNINKSAKYITKHKIIVSTDDTYGGIFINLPNKYSENEVIDEYERCISLDIETIFYGYNFNLDNIEYSGILSDVHNPNSELFEEHYILYTSKKQKEEIIRRIKSNEVFINGLIITIDDITYYQNIKEIL